MGGTRRGFLRYGVGSVAAVSGAGCLNSLGGGTSDVEGGDENGGDGNAAATASFYTLYDFTQNVGGDALGVENAVPTGQHGHGWEPQSDITADIIERDAFVHLGVDGFQRWADEIVAEVERNHEDDLTLIPATEGIDLSEYGDHATDEHDHDHDQDRKNREHAHENENEGGREYGDYDPHFWVDPVKAQAAVENIRDGLVKADGENSDVYEGNAEEYLAELEALDERFEEGLADREHDVVVIAGHDSYQYLAERYDFEIHTPQGVSPDDEASPGEIAETIDLVEEEGIEYVLYDRFDGDTLARTIVQEADGAVDTAMLSPAESITEEWEAEGLDYVGQMEEINLPSLRRAVGAE